MTSLQPLVVSAPVGEPTPDLSAAEVRVLEAIDAQALVLDLVELIRVPSVTGSDAESELQHRQAQRLAALGFDVDAWKLDLAALASHPDFPGTDRKSVV